MTTINTIEDLIRLLDENPEWLAAIRQRLVPPDVRELPAAVAHLTEDVGRLTEEVNSRFDSLTSEMRAESDRINRRFDEVYERFDQVNTRFDRMERESGILRGAHARNAVARQSALIARRLGLRHVRTLTIDELLVLADAADTADLPPNELESFYLADVVTETSDAQGELSYIAVEVSYTVDRNDARRAIRNAQWLERFTGRTARAVVAGLNLHSSAEESVNAGALTWYPVPARILAAE